MEALGDTLLRRLLDALLGAATLWSRREPLDEGRVAAIMEMLALERHRAYAEGIPVYRRLAEEQGLLDGADVRAVVEGMTLGTDVFKSYRPEWLEEGDFAAMTDWVGEVSTCRPEPPGEDVRDVAAWRAALARQGVRLSSSSGTSGSPSFVPRDAATWAALCGNGRFYTAAHEAGAGDFDLVALMPAGDALGLQSAATGLARRAAGSHFLDGPLDEALPGAIAFLRGARRPVLVFGTPFHAAALCDAILADGPPLRPAAGSRLLTGGGWKAEEPMAPEALHALVRRALGLEGGAVIDGYSASELNCVLSTCPEGSYHVPPVVQPLLLDDALEWIVEGEATGLLGFFDPFAGSYPGFLVTGDQGFLTREPCACGLGGWSIRGPITRAPGHEPRGCAGALAAELR